MDGRRRIRLLRRKRRQQASRAFSSFQKRLANRPKKTWRKNWNPRLYGSSGKAGNPKPRMVPEPSGVMISQRRIGIRVALESLRRKATAQLVPEIQQERQAQGRLMLGRAVRVQQQSKAIPVWR